LPRITRISRIKENLATDLTDKKGKLNLATDLTDKKKLGHGELV